MGEWGTCEPKGGRGRAQAHLLLPLLLPPPLLIPVLTLQLRAARRQSGLLRAPLRLFLLAPLPLGLRLRILLLLHQALPLRHRRAPGLVVQRSVAPLRFPPLLRLRLRRLPPLPLPRPRAPVQLLPQRTARLQQRRLRA